MAATQFYGTGKRKSAVARVFLRPGSGRIVVNRREFEDYFTTPDQRAAVVMPLRVVNGLEEYDVMATVSGGGPSGQADAVRHGLARALVDCNAEFRGTLKEKGLLTRDAREKERKKYGQRGARARFQFSKR